MLHPILSRTVVLIAALTPVLTACAPALIATGAAATVLSYHDRRSTGTQADDNTAELKAGNRMPAAYRERAHASFTAFNRVLLITGEVADEEGRLAIGAMAENIEGIRRVYNELLVAPSAVLSSRSNDALISAKFKARLVNSAVSANHIKPVTESGTLFLMGLVNEREASAALAIARTTEGVRKVVSVLEIVPEAETRRLDNHRAIGGAGAARPASAPVESR